MDQGNKSLWLIPVIIIGLTCLLFVGAVAASRSKAAREQGETAAAPSGEATAAEETEETKPSGDEEPWEVSENTYSGLSDSFYDDPAEGSGDEAGDKPQGENIAENKGDFVLLLTSSQSDLQIQMAGASGADAAGIGWEAVVSDGEGTELAITDDDMDGIMYIPEIGTGTYEVKVTGDGVEETSVITVKPRIRYTESALIRSIVMQESEIDAAVEDTALESEDKAGEESYSGTSLPNGTQGIDVSKYNKEIDWARVRASGIEFAIIRAGYRGSSSGVLVEDPYFRANLAGAKAAGMDIGIYFFTQAITEDEAREEAAAVASLVNASDLALPVFLDVESSGNSHGGRADGLDKDTRTRVVKAFCEEAERLGYRAGVYANKTWMTKYLDMSALKPFTKWLAQYRTGSPTYDGEYSIWQYTSAGSVDGITGRVDMNIALDNTLGGSPDWEK